MCIYVHVCLLACLSVHHVCREPAEARRGCRILLQLKLQMAVNHQVLGMKTEPESSVGVAGALNH